MEISYRDLIAVLYGMSFGALLFIKYGPQLALQRQHHQATRIAPVVTSNGGVHTADTARPPAAASFATGRAKDVLFVVREAEAPKTMDCNRLPGRIREHRHER